MTDGLQRLGAAVRGLHGWRRFVVALLAGALATAALPPFHIVPVLLLVLPCLVWLLDGARSWRGAFAVGWSFGLGYFAAGLYWIGNAFMVYAETVGWAAAPAVALLAAGLALFPALTGSLYRALAPDRGAGRILLLAALWTAVEWLRGHILTGFPWNLIGYVWADTPAVAQLAALFGVYGLSFVTVAVTAMPAVLADGGTGIRFRLWAVAGAATLIALVGLGGALRLAGVETAYVPDVRLRLVQPNIPQGSKWDADLAEMHFARHLALSVAKGEARPTHILWPESAVPFLLERTPEALERIAKVVPPGGLVVTGAMRATAPGEAPFRIWNSVRAIDGNGRITATYDKFHLVPFGEYVPFRGLVSMAKLTVGDTDFSAGPGPRTLEIAGAPPVSPLVCYEGIFPAAVTEPGARPAWLLNVTNDGWYGMSTGPHQHLAQTRLRAIEEGLPLVRVANTGISAVTDPYGRMLERLELGRQGFIDSRLPAPLPGGTVYGRYGDAAPALLLASVALVVAGLRRARSLTRAAGDARLPGPT